MSAIAVKEKMVSYPWWMVLLQGIAALVLGGILLAAPAMSTALLIRILGLYWLIDGIFSLVRIFLKNSNMHWGVLLARGIFGILIGLLVIQHPLWSTVLIPTILAIVLGFYGLLVGVIALIEGFKDGIHWGPILLGILSILIGIFLLLNPLVSAVILIPIIGMLAMIFGVGVIILAFRIR